MKRTLILLLLAIACTVTPLHSQQNNGPPPRDVGAETLPPKMCPSDRRDGPRYADGRTYYGITARKIVEGFLAPPHDSFGRTATGTQHLRPSNLRILTDETDYYTCRQLTSALSNGSRAGPPPIEWVYFTAGGFYFLSQWKPAQALSNYTTSYGHVVVFDSNFNLLGVYAF